MTGFTKLFSSIIHSTIWRESKEVKIVWITLLAMAGKDGVVECSLPGLADAARVSVEECEQALKLFQEPDAYSRTTEHEGRRIEKVEGGWRLLNYAKYRERLSADDRREYQRVKQKEYREKKKLPARVANPEHKAFIDGWCQNYQAHYGRKYAFDGGRDAKAVKELLSLGILRLDLLETAKKAWATKPPTFHTGRALTIHGFRDSLNEIQNETSRREPVRNMI